MQRPEDVRVVGVEVVAGQDTGHLAGDLRNGDFTQGIDQRPEPRGDSKQETKSQGVLGIWNSDLAD